MIVIYNADIRKPGKPHNLTLVICLASLNRLKVICIWSLNTFNNFCHNRLNRAGEIVLFKKSTIYLETT